MDQENFSKTDLAALENALRDRLHPIEPDQEFINDLAENLARASLNRRQKQIGQSILIILGGLLIGWLIFWIGREFIKGKQG